MRIEEVPPARLADRAQNVRRAGKWLDQRPQRRIALPRRKILILRVAHSVALPRLLKMDDERRHRLLVRVRRAGGVQRRLQRGGDMGIAVEQRPVKIPDKCLIVHEISL